MLAAVAVVCLELLWLRTGLFRQPAYWLSMLVVFVFMVPVDGWMSKVPNPIVIYDPDVLSGVRFPIDIPLEEFVYAFAMVTLAILLWERAGRESHPAVAGRRTCGDRIVSRKENTMGAVTKYIRIDAPPQQVYELWRDPTGYPEFMEDVNEVEQRGDRWHWKVDGPAGIPVEWDSVIVEDIPGEKLAWKSVEGLSNAGVVRFDDRGDATDLEYAIEFDAPARKAGEVVAKLFDDPESKVQRALESFKRLVERDARPRPDSRTEVDAGEASPQTGKVA
jgi:lycopene cyclase domain-containing protein